MSEQEIGMVSGPLRGVRVLDLTRLAPGPYCSMLLSDMGAEVIVVGGGRSGLPIPSLSRGKQFISLDMKSREGQQAFHALAETADVVIEGFRPGVAHRLNASYDIVSQINPRLIYCSITGYGQEGPRAQEAGHDINYLALSGVLGATGPKGCHPHPPLNLMADFAGGSLLATYGILAALFERERSGEGQYIDVSMVDGCMSMMAMHFVDWGSDVLPERGEGLVSGNAPFYRCYECADGRYISVGALEKPFFSSLWRKLFDTDEPDHMDIQNWPEIETSLAAAFLKKGRDVWCKELAGINACIAPVLDPTEVWSDEHVRLRHHSSGRDSVPVVPLFKRTPGSPGVLDTSDQTVAVLSSLGMAPEIIAAARGKEAEVAITGLSWPPALKNGLAPK